MAVAERNLFVEEVQFLLLLLLKGRSFITDKCIKLKLFGCGIFKYNGNIHKNIVVGYYVQGGCK